MSEYLKSDHYLAYKKPKLSHNHTHIKDIVDEMVKYHRWKLETVGISNVLLKSGFNEFTLQMKDGMTEEDLRQQYNTLWETTDRGHYSGGNLRNFYIYNYLDQKNKRNSLTGSKENRELGPSGAPMYENVVIGGGASALLVLTELFQQHKLHGYLQKKGLAFVYKSGDFGVGNFETRDIMSNSTIEQKLIAFFGEDYKNYLALDYLKDLLPNDSPFFQEDVSQTVNLKKDLAPFLRELGRFFMTAMKSSKGKSDVFKHEVKEVHEYMHEGETYFDLIGENGLIIATSKNNVVLASGVKENEKAQNIAKTFVRYVENFTDFTGKHFSAELFFSLFSENSPKKENKYLKKTLKKLSENPSKKITFLGNSHSTYAAIWKIFEYCAKKDIALHKNQIQIVHRNTTKVSVTPKEAKVFKEKGLLIDFSDKNANISGKGYAKQAGLKGNSKELALMILHQEQNEEYTPEDWFNSSGVVDYVKNNTDIVEYVQIPDLLNAGLQKDVLKQFEKSQLMVSALGYESEAMVFRDWKYKKQDFFTKAGRVDVAESACLVKEAPLNAPKRCYPNIFAIGSFAPPDPHDIEDDAEISAVFSEGIPFFALQVKNFVKHIVEEK